MKISELKQPYRRMAEYLVTQNCIQEANDGIYNFYKQGGIMDLFCNAIDKGHNPPITEEIKKHFPPDFDFLGEKGFVYPYDKNYLKIPINEHSTLLIPKDDLMEKTSNEEKIVYWAKNLEHKSLSLHELVEEGKWLVSHCSNIEDNKQYYTQLVKEGNLDELPDICEFSEPVELEVSDCNEVFKTLDVVGKFKGKFVEKENISCVGYTLWNFAKLPTPKIDFSQFKSGDVVEVELSNEEKRIGWFDYADRGQIVIKTLKRKGNQTCNGGSCSGSKMFNLEKIKSITKIK